MKNSFVTLECIHFMNQVPKTREKIILGHFWLEKYKNGPNLSVSYRYLMIKVK
jgi:hypothetical protein